MFTDKSITLSFTVQELLICVLLVAAIIALIFLIVILFRFRKTAEELTAVLQKANETLDDVKTVVKDAAEITATVKDASFKAKSTIKKASRSVDGFADIVSANKSKISAFTGLVNAGASLASLFGADKKSKQED